MSATELLKECQAIFEQRHAQYGDILPSFNRAASAISMLTRSETLNYEVALQMLGVKLARIANDPTHRDSYVDAINYLCIAFSLAQRATESDRL